LIVGSLCYQVSGIKKTIVFVLQERVEDLL